MIKPSPQMQDHISCLQSLCLITCESPCLAPIISYSVSEDWRVVPQQYNLIWVWAAGVLLPSACYHIPLLCQDCCFCDCTVSWLREVSQLKTSLKKGVILCLAWSSRERTMISPSTSTTVAAVLQLYSCSRFNHHIRLFCPSIKSSNKLSCMFLLQLLTFSRSP